MKVKRDLMVFYTRIKKTRLSEFGIWEQVMLPLQDIYWWAWIYIFSFIIICGITMLGSAGSTIAYRLGENPSNQVLVLEFGGSDFSPFIQMPAALSYPMNCACL